MQEKLDKKTIKDGYLPVNRDERFMTEVEKYKKNLNTFDGLLEDKDEFGDKTVHGFLGPRRGC